MRYRGGKHGVRRCFQGVDFHRRIIKPVAARRNIVGLIAFFLLINLEIITDLRASGGFWAV